MERMKVRRKIVSEGPGWEWNQRLVTFDCGHYRSYLLYSKISRKTAICFECLRLAARAAAEARS